MYLLVCGVPLGGCVCIEHITLFTITGSPVSIHMNYLLVLLLLQASRVAIVGISSRINGGSDRCLNQSPHTHCACAAAAAAVFFVS